MKIKVLEVNQEGNTFYIGKIQARDLVRISTTKVRKSKTVNDYKNYLDEVDDLVKKEIDEGDIWYLQDAIQDANIQRKQSKERLKEIGKYISKANSIFPNAIIINLALSNQNEENKMITDEITITDGELEFNEEKITTTIIDGQHRLGGFNYTEDKEYFLDNYELIVTILIGLEVSQQAELFGVINGKQKPVSKSILYDLTGVSEDEYTELVTAHLITSWFNINDKSPLKGKIKMLGFGEGTVSQAAVIDALLPLIEDKQIRRTIRSEDLLLFPVFRENYLQKDSKMIIKNLYNYFKVVKEIFPEEWDYGYKQSDKRKYILNKTTGISGLLFAYCTIYAYLDFYNDFTYNRVKSLISKLRTKGMDFTSEKYGGGSKQTQKRFAEDILNNLFSKEEIIKYRSNFINKV
ncbi:MULTISPECIES: DGQHR domain-containing protein [Bacillus cereus group]|uniref:DGQHR domain-containing protein n=1 Tax=Bacillus cereus group TaxID=86661 RepID=UPI0001DA5FDD|nr:MULTISPECIES: DGQHR domain-containing protein [Bacillus cereus group]EFI64692.1 hypothetical protein BCSJ1_14885 [Bacillus cereus SJ1]MEC4696068.1 DGQHR domain-containing protein [Bacillus anthracis]